MDWLCRYQKLQNVSATPTAAPGGCAPWFYPWDPSLLTLTFAWEISYTLQLPPTARAKCTFLTQTTQGSDPLLWTELSTGPLQLDVLQAPQNVPDRTWHLASHTGSELDPPLWFLTFGYPSYNSGMHPSLLSSFIYPVRSAVTSLNSWIYPPPPSSWPALV